MAKGKETQPADEIFLEAHKNGMEYGFWGEESRSLVCKCIERNYKKDIIKKWHIVSIVDNGDKFLVKWKKRYRPLTEEEFKKEYGI